MSKTEGTTLPPWRNWLLPLALLVLFLALRLPGLGRFVTTDEALWLRRSANFYLAVRHGAWADTFQSPHPGVLTQWAGAAGFYLVFPQYAQAGSADIHDSQLLRLMENRGVNPLEVLAAGRAILVLLHGAAFLAAWPFARRLLGPRIAALGLALIAFDPFLIAHQRLLHLDGLLASLMLLALLAYLDFLRSGSLGALVVSALAAGLAWLTKTPAWFLLPAILALTAYGLWQHRSSKRSQSPISNLPIPFTIFRRFWLAPVAWLALAVLLFFLLFPAMWVAPLEIPQAMAGYALGSAEGEYGGPVFFNGVIYPDGELGGAGWLFYPLSFLWRSTPLVLAGLGCGLWLAIASFGQKKKPKQKGADLLYALAPPLLLAFSLGFTLFMTLAGKKFDRYLLPALPPLMLVATWGWVRFSEIIAYRGSLPLLLSRLGRASWSPLALLLVVVWLQLLSALPTFPYYLSYYNPLLGGGRGASKVMMVGWGEGLDQAADYLNKKTALPLGRVAAWYSVSFNLMFSMQADDIPVVLQLSPSELAALIDEDYLVIYVHQWQRGTPQNLLDALAPLEPEYRVWISGLEYVRVYRLNEN
ncbi:MAG TPA: glycosyltransferase family 39 protein [Anaerolineales bacterium]|nr:glycosyltransferase family 39 protein [Anaerolineales bacterium]